MLSIESLMSITESAAMDGTPLFDWQKPRTMENPYANRNFRGTGRDYIHETQSFHEGNTEPRERIDAVFLSELETVFWECEKIRTENDRRKNQKIGRETVLKVKGILRKPRYMDYQPEAVSQNMWSTNEGIVFQDRNPELPQIIYSEQSFEIIKKIQHRLSFYWLYRYLSQRDQKYIQGLPNSIHSKFPL